MRQATVAILSMAFLIGLFVVVSSNTATTAAELPEVQLTDILIVDLTNFSVESQNELMRLQHESQSRLNALNNNQFTIVDIPGNDNAILSLTNLNSSADYSLKGYMLSKSFMDKSVNHGLDSSLYCHAQFPGVSANTNLIFDTTANYLHEINTKRALNSMPDAWNVYSNMVFEHDALVAIKLYFDGLNFASNAVAPGASWFGQSFNVSWPVVSAIKTMATESGLVNDLPNGLNGAMRGVSIVKLSDSLYHEKPIGSSTGIATLTMLEPRLTDLNERLSAGMVSLGPITHEYQFKYNDGQVNIAGAGIVTREQILYHQEHHFLETPDIGKFKEVTRTQWSQSTTISSGTAISTSVPIGNMIVANSMNRPRLSMKDINGMLAPENFLSTGTGAQLYNIRNQNQIRVPNVHGSVGANLNSLINKPLTIPNATTFRPIMSPSANPILGSGSVGANLNSLINKPLTIPNATTFRPIMWPRANPILNPMQNTLTTPQTYRPPQINIKPPMPPIIKITPPPPPRIDWP